MKYLIRYWLAVASLVYFFANKLFGFEVGSGSYWMGLIFGCLVYPITKLESLFEDSP